MVRSPAPRRRLPPDSRSPRPVSLRLRLLVLAAAALAARARAPLGRDAVLAEGAGGAQPGGALPPPAREAAPALTLSWAEASAAAGAFVGLTIAAESGRAGSVALYLDDEQASV